MLWRNLCLDFAPHRKDIRGLSKHGVYMNRSHYFKIFIFFISTALCSSFSLARDVCNCQGFAGVGGVCYAGVGGPAYAGVATCSIDG